MEGRRKPEKCEPLGRKKIPLEFDREDVGDQILVVSDLHLGCGREPRTSRFWRRENFFWDTEFRRFLEYHLERKNPPGLLVLNGDIIDFVRIMSVPFYPSEFRRWRKDLKNLQYPGTTDRLESSIRGEERRFGLRTNELKSVWRIQRVIRGHPEFFNALGGWIVRGGRIVFVKGNHDLELYWPLVRKAIQRAIKGGLYGVKFTDNGVRIENLYIEHGHRFESVTAVYGGETTKNGDEINLPPASVISRFLVNKLEVIEPFLNNIKPIDRALRAILPLHPIRTLWEFTLAAFWLLWSAGRYRLRYGIGILFFFGALAISAVFLLALGALVFFLASPTIHLPAAISRLHILGFMILFFFVVFPLIVAIATPYIAGLMSYVFGRRRFSLAEDRYGQGVFNQLQGMKFPTGAKFFYGVIGHTHRPDVQVLSGSSGRWYTYVNSGTWTPNWDRRSNLLPGTEFSFIRFDWTKSLGGYRHRSLVWRDDRGLSGEPVDSVIVTRSQTVG
jgi:UDP-2,3-diacylglucosamine pyrophosphatase LpxH